MMKVALLLAVGLLAAGAAADWTKPDFCHQYDCPRFKKVPGGLPLAGRPRPA